MFAHHAKERLSRLPRSTTRFLAQAPTLNGFSSVLFSQACFLQAGFFFVSRSLLCGRSHGRPQQVVTRNLRTFILFARAVAPWVPARRRIEARPKTGNSIAMFKPAASASPPRASAAGFTRCGTPWNGLGR